MLIDSIILCQYTINKFICEIILKSMKVNSNKQILIQSKCLITDLPNSTTKSIVLVSSSIIIQKIIKDLISKALQEIQQRQVLRSKLSPFSSEKSILCNQQIVLIMFTNQNILQNIQEDDEPVPLKTDNFISIAPNQQKSEIEKRQKSTDSKLVISRNNSINQKLTVLNTQRIAKNVQKNIINIQKSQPVDYVKLKIQDAPLVQTFNDPFVQEMRRRKSQNSNISELKNNKVNKIREIISKDTKIGKLSFDFAGNIIKIFDGQKGNFMTKCLDGELNSAISKVKQVKGDKNPTNLGGEGKKDAVKKMIAKRLVEIEFSSISSLNSQIQVNEGIKFLHNKQIIQKKKKQCSLVEIKKNISIEKLSKQNFQRLKSFEKSRSSISTSLRKNTQLLPNIIKSETQIKDRFQNSKNLSSNDELMKQKTKSVTCKIGKQKISIENEELLSILLQKSSNNNNNNDLINSSEMNVESMNKTLQLSRIDLQNLNFIKTKSVGIVQLPRIIHRINDFKKASLRSIRQQINF